MSGLGRGHAARAGVTRTPASPHPDLEEIALNAIRRRAVLGVSPELTRRDVDWLLAYIDRHLGSPAAPVDAAVADRLRRMAGGYFG